MSGMTRMDAIGGLIAKVIRLERELAGRREDAERLCALLKMGASEQDAVLRPPIPEDLLDSPEAWPGLVRAAIDRARNK